MSGQEQEKPTDWQSLQSLLSLSTDSLNQSSFWTEEEIGRALQADIAHHVRRGWKWVPPFLEKGTIKARPSARFRLKTPADRSFNPAKDAFAFRISPHVQFAGNGVYVLGDLQMRHDGTLIDASACPECGGTRWMVRVPKPITVKDYRAWEGTFTYCRKCVTPAEVEDAKRRAEMYGEEAAKLRRKTRR